MVDELVTAEVTLLIKSFVVSAAAAAVAVSPGNPPLNGFVLSVLGVPEGVTALD